MNGYLADHELHTFLARRKEVKLTHRPERASKE